MPPRVTRLARAGAGAFARSAWNSMHSTLPTPAHVSWFCCRSAKARLITTPREPLSAQWQRWSSANTDSDACSSSVVTAVRAAVAASAPWPSPSTTARSTPVATGFTRCKRSEEHTSELQSQSNLVCRLLLEKKKNKHHHNDSCHHHDLPAEPPPSHPGLTLHPLGVPQNREQPPMPIDVQHRSQTRNAVRRLR